MRRVFATAAALTVLALAGCGQPPPSTPPRVRERPPTAPPMNRVVVTPGRAEMPAGALPSSRSSIGTWSTALDELLAQDLPAEELLERILHLEGDVGGDD